MKKIFYPLLFVLSLLSLSGFTYSNEFVAERSDEPIRLHPDNPHYFLYKGKAMALVTSAEHYGSVLNLDFDYRSYLKTLADEGMNYTRIFTGSYFEIPGESFGIQKNTLAPNKNRIITPWLSKYSEQKGRDIYDLSAWNSAYFERLKDFIELAGEYNIIVEVTLFSSIYRNEHWDISPQNPQNNTNISHSVSLKEAQTLDNGELLDYQELFVKKMVAELNGYDNFFFEIQNEPWSDHAVAVYNIVNKEELKNNDWTYKADFADEQSLAWQKTIAAFISEEENELGRKHLIAQNYTNFRAAIPEVCNNISIINFHYAWPEAVEWNYHFNKVIGFDESGFAGSEDQVYRRQAWQFMLSGGGLFNSLDYSFYPGHEDGLGVNKAPGGGSRTLRLQLKVLSKFLHSFELEKMQADKSCIKSSPGLIPYVLVDSKNAYAVYLRATGTEKTSFALLVGKGKFKVQELNPITGKYSDPISMKAIDGVLNFNIKIQEGELALKIVKE